MFLFHYTSIDTLNMILDNNTLKFNNINDVNDAYESKIFNIYDIEKEIYDRWKNKMEQEWQYNDKIENLNRKIESAKLKYEEIKYFEEKKKAIAFKKKYIDPLMLQYRYFKNKPLSKNKYNEKVIKMSSDKYHYYRKEEYNKVRNGLVKVACFCSGNFDIIEFNKKDVANRRQGFFHPRMWAQYADESLGCCIVFQKEKLKKLFENISDKFYLFEDMVEYVDLLNFGHENKEIILDVIEELTKRGIIRYLKRHVVPLFFRKDKDWSDENEYRFLIINKGDNRKRSPYYMDIKNCIDSIILGENFECDKDTINSIVEKCNKESIALYKLNNDLGVYYLNKI